MIGAAYYTNGNTIWIVGVTLALMLVAFVLACSGDD